MSAPKVTAVAEDSPAARAGLAVGDELESVEGCQPRDVIEFHQLTDGEEVALVVRRPGAAVARSVRVRKEAGEPLGIEVSSAVFDRINTCDNHCAFCFIYQLPKQMRRSLYLKDDDYRLSFLYGNFTTLTRFTELDAERVVDERLSPLFVSIHTTDPELRARMLRNPKGATSLRWLRVLLDAGIEVHGQLVVCPGVNDGDVFAGTLAGICDEYPELASVGVVPLGVSRFSTEPEMRPHTVAEAARICDEVDRWQGVFASLLGRRLVHAADEYYLLAGRPFPPADHYDGFAQHENGIGMARAFEAAFAGDDGAAQGVRHGFFAAVDGAPADGYRAPRTAGGPGGPGGPGGEDRAAVGIEAGGRPEWLHRRTADGPADGPASGAVDDRPIAILTGALGAPVVSPLVGAHPRRGTRILAVENDYFGGNVGVTGLLTGQDLSRVLAGEPEDHRYLLPDVCLSRGRFLDGMTPEDLPRPVEVVPTDGRSLRRVLDACGR